VLVGTGGALNSGAGAFEGAGGLEDEGDAAAWGAANKSSANSSRCFASFSGEVMVGCSDGAWIGALVCAPSSFRYLNKRGAK
jgi:hypothetical protein